MGVLGKQLNEDIKQIKVIFGKKRKSFKQQYEERVKEKEKADEEAMYKAKLDTLDKLEFGEGVKGKLKKKLRELIE